MKFVVFFCLLAVAFALPNRDAVAIRDDRNIEADGSHSYAYEIDNGIRVSEEGRPVTNGAISKTGEIR
ncbi:hypothetical protein Avbf_16500 [Armadillidium vulgare]|nr:hypothetical protein Avbf_16500 [Armadillidium vulgare]